VILLVLRPGGREPLTRMIQDTHSRARNPHAVKGLLPMDDFDGVAVQLWRTTGVQSNLLKQHRAVEIFISRGCISSLRGPHIEVSRIWDRFSRDLYRAAPKRF
jgi:hypothetical protein